MSFRIRVLLLVVLVTGCATAATVLLTLQQASAQVTASTAADEQQVDLIRREVRAYGYQHGTWEGVSRLVDQLSHDTGQRIYLRTEFGTVVVDSDTLRHPSGRPVDGQALYIDPRPVLQLGPDARTWPQTTLDAIGSYRSGVHLAACLSRHDWPIVVADQADGVPRFAADPTVGPPPDDVQTECEAAAAAEGGYALGDAGAQVKSCARGPGDIGDCLRRVFVDEISTNRGAPVPLLLVLGGPGATPSLLSSSPILLGALGVAMLVAVGAALISRRVLRPIATLTAASRRLGAGDLAERVPVTGGDELADLAHSFNRMADSLQRGEERQRRLIADVAHELRTPLANLRGYLEALQDGVLDATPEVLASLHEESVLQQRIVDDLQDLALADAQALVYHRAPTNLAELAETVRTAHYAVAEAAGVELRVEADGPVPALVDPDRIRQAVGNLVSNAVRATPGGGTITVRAARVGEWARIEVADTGTGIEPVALPYIFDRFWRADAARTRQNGGSGLGLAIVRQIVSDHRGEITVRSTPGRGTVFTMTLDHWPGGSAPDGEAEPESPRD